MAPWIKCLSCNYEDLSSYLHHPSKNPDVVALVAGARVGRSRCGVRWPASLGKIASSTFREGFCLKIGSGGWLRKTSDINFWLDTHIYRQVYTERERSKSTAMSLDALRFGTIWWRALNSSLIHICGKSKSYHNIPVIFLLNYR